MNVSFFSDLLSTISERGRGLIGLGRGEEHARATVADLVKLSHELISRRGEASGVALARIILDRYSSLPQKDRFAYLIHIAADFGSDEDAIEQAVDSYRKAPTRAAAHALHEAAEPKSQELIRRLNLAAGGTLSLVRMREDLIDLFQTLRTERSDAAIAVESLDQDFVHLFSSWFNRGFLVLRRIDWTTPAHILEKIIRYEAVHEISDWDDLRRRIAPADRRCFAFFHPALVDEPLIFVEVALTTDVPGAIAPILKKEREPIPLRAATTATFYSISNCQRGLAGVSFGNFLIKQVVEDLCRELPNLKIFVTLSPVPGFAGWLARELKSPEPTGITPEDRELLRLTEEPEWFAEAGTTEAVRKPLLSAAAYYFLRAKTSTGRPVDPVARFHLGNGARLERLNFLGDTSPKGVKQSQGLMVNYLYDLDTIEKHHEAYANLGVVTASSAVQKALRREAPSRAVPAAE
jgi:malonyl-CoA decarboxylase